AGPTWIVGASLIYLGSLATLQDDDARATDLYAEAFAESRRAGLRRGLAFARNEMGNVARARGDLERARQLHQEALPVVREILGWSVPHTLAHTWQHIVQGCPVGIHSSTSFRGWAAQPAWHRSVTA
ncbi:MAG TPA: tetratricopeptide repeat protein, partial [Actinomycetes bacterium]